MSSSPIQERGRSRHRSFSQRSSSIAIHETFIPAPTRFKAFRKDEAQIATIQNRKVREFYEHQNEMVDLFLEVDHIIESLERGENPLECVTQEFEDEESGIANGSSQPLLGKPNLRKSHSSKIVHLAINLSMLANVVLFVTKIVTAYVSNSISILASAFETLLDLLSNAIIWYTIRVIKHEDYYGYPIGKSRMEPLGIVVFAVITTTSFTQVLITSAERLMDPENSAEIVDLSFASISVLLANIVIKTALWLWCRSIRGSSSVQALAQDHENDVIFNIAATICPMVGIWTKLGWIDPVGGIFLSIYIIYEWMAVLLDNIRRLSGRAATVDDVKQITYMAYRFSHQIQAIETVRAYYVGDKLFVEIDIVMPPDMLVHIAHDIAEALQDALELMENVERAFVHVDYNTTHTHEHSQAF
ncbi:cation efflux family-domain-containing protein [Umbelopsis sp. PMI_123]|nr:cation efflux family-domain-containing protein [Umbelopsis sp. PMI_123]